MEERRVCVKRQPDLRTKNDSTAVRLHRFWRHPGKVENERTSRDPQFVTYDDWLGFCAPTYHSYQTFSTITPNFKSATIKPPFYQYTSNISALGILSLKLYFNSSKSPANEHLQNNHKDNNKGS